MGPSDPSFQQAILYLQAANVDITSSTRDRVTELIQAYPTLPTHQVLEKLPAWFDVQLPTVNATPPIDRGSIGYGRD